MRHDVVVVGAGPAGAATAILLAEQGFDVLLVDRARFPRDKVCGEYLSPEAGRILDRLGVLGTVGARPIRGMRILAPDGTLLVGDYPADGRGRGHRTHALAVRRRVLDAALVERARAAGVSVREGQRVVDLVREKGRIAGVVTEPAVPGAGAGACHPARLVVAADGRASVVVERLGLRRPHRWLRRLALVADVEGAGGDPERGEIVVVPPAYAILNPVTASVGNLSLVVPLEEGRRQKAAFADYFDAATRALPGLGDRLRHARRVGPVRVLGPLAYEVTPPRDDGIVLVGDAAGFLDPFTGEGVYAALRSAEVAAEVAGRALRTGDVSASALRPAHVRRTAEFAAKTRVTLLLQRVIARRALLVPAARLLARRPAHLARLMGVLGDFVRPGALLEPRFLSGLLPRSRPRLVSAGEVR
ncbi:MAG TPA: NAD(P)/FAD-dependent oxidoreductase [Methylomirabilota bacterium]|jgi:flavin-dependent dehydrogenase